MNAGEGWAQGVCRGRGSAKCCTALLGRSTARLRTAQQQQHSSRSSGHRVCPPTSHALVLVHLAVQRAQRHPGAQLAEGLEQEAHLLAGGHKNDGLVLQAGSGAGRTDRQYREYSEYEWHRPQETQGAAIKRHDKQGTGGQAVESKIAG